MQTQRMSSGRFYCLTAWGYLVQTEISPKSSSLDDAQRGTQRPPAPERAPGCFWHSPAHQERDVFIFTSHFYLQLIQERSYRSALSRAANRQKKKKEHCTHMA